MKKSMEFVEIVGIILIVVWITLIGRETTYQKVVEQNCGDNTKVLNDLVSFGSERAHISRGDLSIYPFYLNGVYSVDVFRGADLIKTLSFPVEKTEEIEGGFRLRSFIWEGDIKVCTVPFYHP